MPVPTAVLFSAGLDSAVLLAEEAARGEVQPVYVSTGLVWESAERDMVGRLLASPAFAGVRRPLASLTVDMRDVYASSHWAIAGDAPAYHTPDEDVYLVGRNIVLLGKAAVHCAAAGLGRIVLGTLAHNPFPDATPEFRAAMTEALTLGLGSPIQIDAPYADVGKAEVVRRGIALHIPFELTLSCMQPILEEGTMARHCGTCSKCRERHEAFLQAKAEDPTIYVDTRFVSRSAPRS
jgi:7-cyano-7-deazaguanine synthase